MPLNNNAAPLRQRDILRFWLPLLASWVLMLGEGPVISAAINRLPNEVIMLAAQGIVYSLAVTLESPIINLLATATALVRDRQSYRQMRRFTLHWMVLLTAASVALAFTPLFDVVVPGWLGAPPEVAGWVRSGLQIMTLWSAAIAWRRFLQGVLIAFDHTRQVTLGAAIRLAASGGGAIALAIFTGWPGVYIGTIALMSGVIAEALYATVAVRPLLRNEMPERAEEGDPLSYRELFQFHLPLAGTSLLILLAQPLVTSTLARLDNPKITLAAWPIVFQLLLVMRTIALALPETVIALSKREDAFRPVRRFSLTVTGVSLVSMVVLVFTPLSDFYILRIQDTDPAVAAVALTGLFWFLPLPALNTLISWLRGLLINQRATMVVNYGMVLNLTTTALILGTGLSLQWPGIVTAAVALVVALMVELLYLQSATQRRQQVPLWPWQRSKPAAAGPPGRNEP